MTFNLTILGAAAATPAYDRFTTAQVLTVADQGYLIDCGEGAQMRLQQYYQGRGRIRNIFISHLHGDHYLGLMGLLMSYALNDRTEPLALFSPPGLRRIVEVQLQYSGGPLPFPVQYHEVDTTIHQQIFSDHRVEVFSIPLRHRIPTAGYLFRERPRQRNIRPESIAQYQIHYSRIPAIKAGADLELPGGRTVPNAELTVEPPPPRAFAFCSDTRYEEGIVPYIEGVDLLYHEATYCEDRREQAVVSMHSTALEAARIARMAKAGKLILGHYSARYDNLADFLEEARSVFPATELGLDGKGFSVPARPRAIEGGG